MTHELTPYDDAPLSPISPIIQIGHVADEEARQGRLASYQESKSAETLRRQHADLALFQTYLADKWQLVIDGLFTSIEEWQGISWGMVEGFKDWMKLHSYSMRSINVRLSTVRRYARIATESNIIPLDVGIAIQGIKGYDKHEAANADEKRPADQRRQPNAKKATPTPISLGHLQTLREMLERDESYIGRRDLLLACLFGYQGFRCGEVAGLKVSEVDIDNGKIVLYRHKVKLIQTHKMHAGTLRAFQRYFAVTKPAIYVFEGVDRDAWTDREGTYHKAHHAVDGLSTRAINARIQTLGTRVGIQKLSPHDLRHYWTRDAFEKGTPIDIIKSAGGWNSYAMPDHYRGEIEIANKGIKQSEW